jgi:transposase InsO family protein
LKRDFRTDRPDQKWLTDITYIPTQEGWLYLAAILDLYTRRFVGWAMAQRMTVALITDALKMATAIIDQVLASSTTPIRAA